MGGSLIVSPASGRAGGARADVGEMSIPVALVPPLKRDVVEESGLGYGEYLKLAPAESGGGECLLVAPPL